MWGYRDYPKAVSPEGQTAGRAMHRHGDEARLPLRRSKPGPVAKLDPMNMADLVSDTVAPAALTSRWPNRYSSLGEGFFTALPAEPLPDPHWVATSDACAALLGLPADWATRADLNALEVFSGHATWPGMRALATDRKSTRLNSSHIQKSRMPSSA